MGASVAGGPLEERPIVWTPHGLRSEEARRPREPRPGWWLPLYGYRTAQAPLRLADVRNTTDVEWIRRWIADRQARYGRAAAPFQKYREGIRPNEAWLTKMPRPFVERWPSLRIMRANAEEMAEKLVPVGEGAQPEATRRLMNQASQFTKRPIGEYLAVVRIAVQRRSRKHEELVNDLAAAFRTVDIEATNPSPLDLLISGDPPIIVEVKVASNGGTLHAIREAVGQLMEYRHFDLKRAATLCIVLDQAPDRPEVVEYVESTLGIMLMWRKPPGFGAGPITAVGPFAALFAATVKSAE